MAIPIHIHKTHRQHTEGLEVVEAEGKTVGECLKHLITQYSGMENAIFAKKDKLQNYIEIYLNNESAYPNELAKPTKDDDTIHIIIMLAGG